MDTKKVQHQSERKDAKSKEDAIAKQLVEVLENEGFKGVTVHAGKKAEDSWMKLLDRMAASDKNGSFFIVGE